MKRLLFALLLFAACGSSALAQAVGNGSAAPIGPIIYGSTYGMQCNGRFVSDGVTNSTTTLTSATANFTQADVGKLIAAFNLTTGGAGTATTGSATTIASVTNSTTVILSQAATASLTGAQVFLASDDTTARQNAITAAANGTLQYPQGYCGVSAAATIPSAITMQGVGVYEQFGTATNGGTTQYFPVTPPYLTGTVIWQFTPATDIDQITAEGTPVNYRNMGWAFVPPFYSTGSCVNTIPPTDGSNYNSGAMSSKWDRVACYGNDGNHYAYIITNSLNSNREDVHSYGGGGVELLQQSTRINYGNEVWTNGYFVTLIGGSAHAMFANNASVGGANILNYVLFQRTQSEVLAPNPAIAGTSAPTGTQYNFQQAGTVNNFGFVAGDFESSGVASVKVNYPVLGSFFTPGGNKGAPVNTGVTSNPTSGTAYQNNAGVAQEWCGTYTFTPGVSTAASVTILTSANSSMTSPTTYGPITEPSTTGGGISGRSLYLCAKVAPGQWFQATFSNVTATAIAKFTLVGGA